MTCEEGRKIISAVTVHNDKLVVLDCIKRYTWRVPSRGNMSQCGILTCVDSDEPLQPPIKLRN